MICGDYHVHSVFSDGRDTLEDIAAVAYKTGMKEIGFSDHSPMIFDTDWNVRKDRMKAYRETVELIKNHYEGRLKILCGIERDLYADRDYGELDYVIGSVHFVKKDGVFCPVDSSFEELQREVTSRFAGDYLSFAEYYYEEVASLSLSKKLDIVGHFDLVTKFNEKEKYLDTESERYKKAWKCAADELIKRDVPFEINTGAISRGYRTTPYPSKEICGYIASRGGRFILSSDSHKKETLRYKFDEFGHYANGRLVDRACAYSPADPLI